MKVTAHNAKEQINVIFKTVSEGTAALARIFEEVCMCCRV